MVDRRKNFQPGPFSKNLTIANLLHAASKIWSCAEAEFRFQVSYCFLVKFYQKSNIEILKLNLNVYFQNSWPYCRRCRVSNQITCKLWKVSKYRVISGPYIPVFSPSTGKYGPEKTSYLDTFHALCYFAT